MIDYVYEVRGTDDPIEGDKVRFKTKDEAMAYYEESKAEHPNAAVYIIEYEFDDFEGMDNMTSIPEQRDVVQIAGPDVETITTPDGFPDTCAGDCSDNYDDKGMFRLPKYNDGLDDDDDITVNESLSEDVKKGTDQYVKLVHDSASKVRPNQDYDLFDIKQLFKDCDTTKKRFSEKDINLIAKFDNHCKVIKETDKGVLVNVPCYYRDPKDRTKILDKPKYIEVWAAKTKTKPITESFEDDDDIETESFAEELFSALSAKRDERAFPEDKLDLSAPHKDVPVVDCKVNPAITHAKDEQPLKEGDFFGGNEDDSEVNYMQVRGYETKKDFDNGYAGMIEAGEEDFFNSCKEDVDNGTYYAVVLGDFSCSYNEEEVEYDDEFIPTKVYPEGLDVSHLIED